MRDKRKVLVSGATGQQGGALVKALLQDGHHVIGLSRTPDSQKAKALISQGVEIKNGNFLDAEELIPVMREVDTVFAMTTPFEKGTDHEIQQGLALATAAQKAKVGHFIYSSVASADQSTGIPHFDSKFEVEKHISTLGMPFTIVAPVFFMDNLFSPWMLDSLKGGEIKMALPGNRLLQQIAVADIAKFSGMVVNKREEMFGKRYDIAGDEVSGDDSAALLSKATGKPVSYEGFDPEYIMAQSEDMALMFKWFDEVGYSADISGLKMEFPEVSFQSFEAWTQQQNWAGVI